MTSFSRATLHEKTIRFAADFTVNIPPNLKVFHIALDVLPDLSDNPIILSNKATEMTLSDYLTDISEGKTEPPQRTSGICAATYEFCPERYNDEVQPYFLPPYIAWNEYSGDP